MKKIIGVDLGDKENVYVVQDEQGQEQELAKMVNVPEAFDELSAKYPGADFVLEAGTHSRWISALLESRGHKVVVGNPRRLRLVWASDSKSDPNDARLLAEVYRLSPRLLHPVHHRSEWAHSLLEEIKARDVLVESRTKLICHIRSVVKSAGGRIGSCSAESFHKVASTQIPACLGHSLGLLLEMIEHMTQGIKQQDRRLMDICRDECPAAQRLLEVSSVGPVTALTFVLTIEDPHRFKHSRQVGKYLGLVPRRDQSGQTDKQLPITKAGNPLLRRLLVSCAQRILGPHGPDCNLKRQGLRIAERGGQNAKKRAVVAVARKLAVVLHRIWANDVAYQPNYKKNQAAA